MRAGFTLIELSIVLVIIGLIVGGVLVGRDLISAAAARAQVSQIESFNQAANTFRGKYNALPGDMRDEDATKFGFLRGYWDIGCVDPCSNGNGIIGNNEGGQRQSSEPHLFWVDLAAAKLIQNSVTPYLGIYTDSTNIAQYLPPARIGDSHYVYVWSGGVVATSYVDGATGNDGINYYTVAAMTTYLRDDYFESYPRMRVRDAYNIDNKVDDGLPQSGKVKAFYSGRYSSTTMTLWAGNSSQPDNVGGATTAATPASSTTCYDNGNVTGAQRYSLSTNNGSGTNCALSFVMQ